MGSNYYQAGGCNLYETGPRQYLFPSDTYLNHKGYSQRWRIAFETEMTSMIIILLLLYKVSNKTKALCLYDYYFSLNCNHSFSFSFVHTYIGKEIDSSCSNCSPSCCCPCCCCFSSTKHGVVYLWNAFCFTIPSSSVCRVIVHESYHSRAIIGLSNFPMHDSTLYASSG